MKSGSEEINVESQVKRHGLEIDNKLNFEQQINGICKSTANQLKALTKLKRFIGFQKRKVRVDNFVLSNFNCCSHVEIFASSKSLSRIESLYKIALGIKLND